MQDIDIEVQIRIGGTVTDLLNGHFTLFKVCRFGFDFFGTPATR